MTLKPFFALTLLLFALHAPAAEIENESPPPPEVQSKIQTVLAQATNLIGIRYSWGGKTVEHGLDCSGLVQYVFKTVGLTLPPTAAQQSKVGVAVAESDLKPGDLVFFNTTRKAISHVGVYLGNRLFVHAPHTGTEVRVDSLDSSYWVHTYYGGRRVAGALQPSVTHWSAGSPDAIAARVLAILNGRTSGDSPQAEATAPDAAEAIANSALPQPQ
ncbi:NlpC/P60 family protein [Paraburkholderia sp. UCT31]|uniref:C40 family peptidase n=1 Tax=Paraburkholderia sp. UCT31 TaxID=2615209 RepID=UPI0016564C00|nr:C40 family peptidase [Paraburkholderia sp. UCT31]MBC8738520.1 NlpC/P60 family protein [Paraburkholderia sp. UCT31]